MSFAEDYRAVNGNSFTGLANNGVALLNFVNRDFFLALGSLDNCILWCYLNKALNRFLCLVLAHRVNITSELDEVDNYCGRLKIEPMDIVVMSHEYHHNRENAVNKACQNAESNKSVHVRRAMKQVFESALDDVKAVNKERYRQNKQ